jgi:hypothetical protein
LSSEVCSQLVNQQSLNSVAPFVAPQRAGVEEQAALDEAAQIGSTVALPGRDRLDVRPHHGEPRLNAHHQASRSQARRGQPRRGGADFDLRPPSEPSRAIRRVRRCTHSQAMGRGNCLSPALTQYAGFCRRGRAGDAILHREWEGGYRTAFIPLRFRQAACHHHAYARGKRRFLLGSSHEGLAAQVRRRTGGTI